MNKTVRLRPCPCGACTDRVVGCHSKCALYKEWNKLRKKVKWMKDSETEAWSYEYKNAYFRQDIKCIKF